MSLLKHVFANLNEAALNNTSAYDWDGKCSKHKAEWETIYLKYFIKCDQSASKQHSIPKAKHYSITYVAFAKATLQAQTTQMLA